MRRPVRIIESERQPEQLILNLRPPLIETVETSDQLELDFEQYLVSIDMGAEDGDETVFVPFEELAIASLARSLEDEEDRRFFQMVEEIAVSHMMTGRSLSPSDLSEPVTSSPSSPAASPASAG